MWFRRRALRFSFLTSFAPVPFVLSRFASNQERCDFLVPQQVPVLKMVDTQAALQSRVSGCGKVVLASSKQPNHSSCSGSARLIASYQIWSRKGVTNRLRTSSAQETLRKGGSSTTSHGDASPRESENRLVLAIDACLLTFQPPQNTA